MIQNQLLVNHHLAWCELELIKMFPQIGNLRVYYNTEGLYECEIFLTRVLHSRMFQAKHFGGLVLIIRNTIK